ARRRGGGGAGGRPLRDGGAVRPRHGNVDIDEVDRLRLKGARGLLAVLHRRDVVADAAQALLEDPAQAVLVVGDQDARSHQARAMGRKQVTTVPRASELSTWMAPWCSSRMRCQTGRPRPRART